MNRFARICPFSYCGSALSQPYRRGVLPPREARPPKPWREGRGLGEGGGER